VQDAEIHKAMEMAELAKRANIPEPLRQLAIALAMAETRGYTDRVGDLNLVGGIWGPSVGPMQTRTMPAQTGTGGPRDIERVSNPLENMKAALELFKGGRFDLGGEAFYEPGGWDQWSTYKSGAYEKFMPMAARAMSLNERVQ
jgi:hypothetical protein